MMKYYQKLLLNNRTNDPLVTSDNLPETSFNKFCSYSLTYKIQRVGSKMGSDIKPCSVSS